MGVAVSRWEGVPGDKSIIVDGVQYFRADLVLKKVLAASPPPAPAAEQRGACPGVAADGRRCTLKAGHSHGCWNNGPFAAAPPAAAAGPFVEYENMLEESLLRYGGCVTDECQNMLRGGNNPCTCGWQDLKDNLVTKQSHQPAQEKERE